MTRSVRWDESRPVPVAVVDDDLWSRVPLDSGFVFGIDGPAACDCPALPNWHTEDQCAEDGPDPDVCAGCDHQRAFHDPCLGIDCDCGGFVDRDTH